jgi:hypothetical protein
MFEENGIGRILERISKQNIVVRDFKLRLKRMEYLETDLMLVCKFSIDLLIHKT